MKKTVELLELDEMIVKKALHPISIQKRNVQEIPHDQQKTSVSQVSKMAERLLSLALQKKEYFDYVVALMDLEYIPNDYATLYKLLVSYYTIHKSVTHVHEVSGFLRQEHQELEHRYLTLLTRGEEELVLLANEERVYQELKALITRLQRSFLETRKKEFSSLIRQTEAAGDSKNLHALLEQFQTISDRLAQLDA